MRAGPFWAGLCCYPPRMHQHLTDAFSHLDRSRAALRASVDAIDAPLRQRRPEPDRWSAAEVLEHLSIVERLFSGRIADAIDAARASGLDPEAAARTPLPEAIHARMMDRVNKRHAPDPARPTGTLDAQTAWDALEGGHRRLRALVGGADGLALSQVSIDHAFFGAMNVYQWVELMAAHETRHTEQIKEIAVALAASGR
jgi:DinB superfamily